MNIVYESGVRARSRVRFHFDSLCVYFQSHSFTDKSTVIVTFESHLIK